MVTAFIFKHKDKNIMRNINFLLRNSLDTSKHKIKFISDKNQNLPFFML